MTYHHVTRVAIGFGFLLVIAATTVAGELTLTSAADGQVAVRLENPRGALMLEFPYRLSDAVLELRASATVIRTED